MNSKVAKRIGIGVAILLVVFIVLGFIAGNYFYTLALDPGQDKSRVFDGHSDEEKEAAPDAIPQGLTKEQSEAWKIQREQTAAWYNMSDRQDLYLESYDGLRLHATQVEQESSSNKWTILCHGYTGEGDQMAHSGKRFYDMGYNILLPDARGHGQSEGNYIGMGWNDRLDIVNWINYIVSANPNAEIVLYGVSMGGATVMMVAGEDLPSNVKAIVEDCGYSSIWDEFTYQLEVLFKLPSFPIMQFASAVTKIRASYWLGEGDAVAQVAKSKTPILFIHGESDAFVPYAMLDKVYEAATVPKQKLSVPNAEHGMAAMIAGEDYWDTVQNFIEQYH